MRLLLCVVIFYYLPWFCSIKVSNKKLQHHAEKACGNRMCKRAFKKDALNFKEKNTELYINKANFVSFENCMNDKM